MFPGFPVVFKGTCSTAKRHLFGFPGSGTASRRAPDGRDPHPVRSFTQSVQVRCRKKGLNSSSLADVQWNIVELPLFFGLVLCAKNDES